MTSKIMQRYVSDYKAIALLSVILDILLCVSIIFYLFAPMFQAGSDGLFSGLTYSLMDNIRLFVNFYDLSDFGNLSPINVIETLCILLMALSFILAVINAVKEIIFLNNVEEHVTKKHTRFKASGQIVNHAIACYFATAVLVITITFSTIIMEGQETMLFGIHYNREMIIIFAILSAITIIFNCISAFFVQRMQMYNLIEQTEPSYFNE